MTETAAPESDLCGPMASPSSAANPPTPPLS